jgi:hypothetical protein
MAATTRRWAWPTCRRIAPRWSPGRDRRRRPSPSGSATCGTTPRRIAGGGSGSRGGSSAGSAKGPSGSSPALTEVSAVSPSGDLFCLVFPGAAPAQEPALGDLDPVLRGVPEAGALPGGGYGPAGPLDRGEPAAGGRADEPSPRGVGGGLLRARLGDRDRRDGRGDLPPGPPIPPPAPPAPRRSRAASRVLGAGDGRTASLQRGRGPGSRGSCPVGSLNWAATP